MKTIDKNKIKEAANNYVVSNFLEQCTMKQYIIDSFETGFELCEQVFKEKLRWIPIEENLPPLKTWVICKHEEIYDTYFFDNEFQMAGCIKRFLITEWRFFL